MNEEMLLAAHALAEVIPEEDLSEDYVIPSVFDERVVPNMAEAVAEATRESGSTRATLEEEDPLEAPPQV
jgi:malate dehydrogenase (oxaloacetate-decarboxylating)